MPIFEYLYYIVFVKTSWCFDIIRYVLLLLYLYIVDVIIMEYILIIEKITPKDKILDLKIEENENEHYQLHVLHLVWNISINREKRSDRNLGLKIKKNRIK